MEAVRLVKMGKPEDGLELLYKACNKYKNDSEPAYNVEMALVEILICQVYILTCIHMYMYTLTHYYNFSSVSFIIIASFSIFRESTKKPQNVDASKMTTAIVLTFACIFTGSVYIL